MWKSCLWSGNNYLIWCRDEGGWPLLVTLSAAKGLSRWPLLVTLSRSEGSVLLGVEMLRGVYPERSECAQHDRAFRLLPPSVVTLSAAKGLSCWPLLVTLSRSEGSVLLGVEMLRGVYPERSECAQHDRAFRLLPPSVVTLSEAKGLSRGATRDASLRLSMTGRSACCLTVSP